MKSTYCSTSHSCNPSTVTPKAWFPPQFSTQFSATSLSGVPQLKVSWPVIRSLHRWICNLGLGKKTFMSVTFPQMGSLGANHAACVSLVLPLCCLKGGTEWQNYFSHNTKKVLCPVAFSSNLKAIDEQSELKVTFKLDFSCVLGQSWAAPHHQLIAAVIHQHTAIIW